MAFSRGIGNFGVRGPRSAAAAVPFVPTDLANSSAWFDPSYKVYSDLSATPSNVGDIVRQWVSKHDDTLVAEAVSDATSPILREGSNGERYLEFDGSDDRLLVTQALAAGTIAFGVRRSATDGNFGRVVGVQTPNDVFVYAVTFDGTANTTVVYFRNEDGSDQVTFTLGSGSVRDWQAYSGTYEGNGQTNRFRRRGETDGTVAGATPTTNSVWSIGAGGAVYGKVDVTHVIRYSSVHTTADRAKVENYIYGRLPT